MNPAPTTWVLLRGLTRERRHWGTFLQSFTEQMPGARVIALDLPGNGVLNAQRSPQHVEDLAEYGRAELQRLGVMPPYHLLAMSLGAMVATAWAARHPQELTGAVLINTSLRPFSPPHRRLKPAAFTTLLRLTLTNPGVREWEQAVLRLTSHAPGPADALLDAWAAIRRERPVSAANALRQLWAAARFEAPRARPLDRVLVLTSAADRLVDTRCSHDLARAWQCPIASHPWAGHDLPLDDAAWVARQVCDWLEAALRRPIGERVPDATACEG